MKLTYRDSDGVTRVVEDCSLYQDKAGRCWLWSERTQSNLAYKVAEREDCLISALDHALFIIKLRDERIAELQRIVDIAMQFADALKPDDLEPE